MARKPRAGLSHQNERSATAFPLAPNPTTTGWAHLPSRRRRIPRPRPWCRVSTEDREARCRPTGRRRSREGLSTGRSFIQAVIGERRNSGRPTARSSPSANSGRCGPRRCSFAGDQFAQVAIAILVYHRTHSPVPYRARLRPHLPAADRPRPAAFRPRRPFPASPGHDHLRPVPGGDRLARRPAPHVPFAALCALLFCTVLVGAPFSSARSAPCSPTSFLATSSCSARPSGTSRTRPARSSDSSRARLSSPCWTRTAPGNRRRTSPCPPSSSRRAGPGRPAPATAGSEPRCGPCPPTASA